MADKESKIVKDEETDKVKVKDKDGKTIGAQG